MSCGHPHFFEIEPEWPDDQFVDAEAYLETVLRAYARPREAAEFCAETLMELVADGLIDVWRGHNGEARVQVTCAGVEWLLNVLVDQSGARTEKQK